MKPDKS